PFREHESHEPPAVLRVPVKGSARDDRDPLTLDEMHRAREIVVEREPSEVRHHIVRASRRAAIEADFLKASDEEVPLLLVHRSAISVVSFGQVLISYCR